VKEKKGAKILSFPLSKSRKKNSPLKQNQPTQTKISFPLRKSQSPPQTTMKFKAFLTETGINLLEKRFIPSLEKTSKTCHILFTKTHTLFLHNLLNGDGIQSIAQFTNQILFDDYRISSQNDDRIAFVIDLSLLLRALRSSVAVCSEYSSVVNNRLQIKLVKKVNQNCSVAAPFLTFETRGFKSAVVQDIPISKPLSRAQVVELQNALDMAQDIPQTLIQVLIIK
jgi:HUS1 checkpoint protein